MYLEEVMMCTLRPPRADMATMNGIIHDITPNTLSPKVCKIFNFLTLCTGIGSFETFLLGVMEWQTICHTRLELFLKPCFNLIVWSVICLNVTRVLLNGVKHKTYHSYGVRSNNLCGCEDSEICKIRQHINSCHKW